MLNNNKKIILTVSNKSTTLEMKKNHEPLFNCKKEKKTFKHHFYTHKLKYNITEQ